MEMVVLTGAGMSQESGLKTFRDSNGLWNDYNIYDVATPEAFQKNPELVLNFYNERRKQLFEVEPNDGHHSLAEFEEFIKVSIITQNVDNLHERAGSTEILHLHGELTKARSTINENNVYDIDGPFLNLGDLCEMGSQLRPHIVWFGEDVPLIRQAEKSVARADILLIIGTSLNVYPAAGLLHNANPSIPIYLIDPSAMEFLPSRVHHIKEKASVGLQMLKPILLQTIGI